MQPKVISNPEFACYQQHAHGMDSKSRTPRTCHWSGQLRGCRAGRDPISASDTESLLFFADRFVQVNLMQQAFIEQTEFRR